MLLKSGKKRVKRRCERDIIFHVNKLMKKEPEKGITTPVSKVQERVMAETHVSRSNLYRA
jgi:hypothetical protein